MPACRLIIDAPQSGAANMAIDEAILSTSITATDSRPTLRMYQWSKPTLSLGYFQTYASRDQHEPSRQCDCVRRHSGGGAIMHDREITYSLTIPISDRWSAGADDLYQQVHGQLVFLFQELGLDAELAVDGEQSQFLCFQRRSNGDILVDNQKITGSAQRRHRGAILQHGSILLERSVCAPELAGLGDLGAPSISHDEFAHLAAQKIAAALGLNPEPDVLSKEEDQLASQLVHSKFGDQAWTRRR